MGTIICPFCRTEVGDDCTGCPRCGAEYGVLPGGISKTHAELGRADRWRGARNSLFIAFICFAGGLALGSYESSATSWIGTGAVVAGVVMAARCLLNIARAMEFSIAAKLPPTWHQVRTTCDDTSPSARCAEIRLKELNDKAGAEAAREAQLERRRHVIEAFGKWLEAPREAEVVPFLERFAEAAVAADRDRIADFLKHLEEDEPAPAPGALKPMPAASRSFQEATNGE